MTGVAAAEAKRTVVTGDAQTLDKVVAFFCARFGFQTFELKTVEEVAARFEADLAKSPSGLTTFMDAPAADEILAVCLDLAKMLLQKNKAYGNSALEPVRIFSKADAAEQIKVRMDDKMSRLMRGEAAGEDALGDFVGYWVLLQVLQRRRNNGHSEG